MFKDDSPAELNETDVTDAKEDHRVSVVMCIGPQGKRGYVYRTPG
jgi:hypothetical protein